MTINVGDRVCDRNDPSIAGRCVAIIEDVSGFDRPLVVEWDDKTNVPWSSESEQSVRPIVDVLSYVNDTIHPEFIRNVQALFDVQRDLLLKKHADYGPDNIAGAPGGPLNGLRVRMWDKLARINHLTDSFATPENEPLVDSFADLANYSIIALLVLRGEWPGLG